MQHHFTTPEQATRLLELGVPQTSADMYCFRDVAGNLYYNMVPSWQPIFSKERFWKNFPHDYTPIWSVGQLIWILGKLLTPPQRLQFATGFPSHKLILDYTGTFVLYLCEFIENGIIITDFSKLED